MKIIKIMLALFAGLALLVGGVVAYVAATFDPNTYKAQVIQLVKDKKQRTLLLDGDIKLKFWPNIGVDLGKVALSEFKSDAPFAAVDNLRVALKVMPLLSRKVVVDEVEVRGIKASVIKFKNGKLNIDDLLSKDDSKSQAIEFDIDHVNIANANLTYRDEAQRTTYSLSNVNLKTGRIAPNVPGKIDLSMQVRGDKPAVDLAVSLKTTLTFDLDNRHFDLDGMTLETRGQAADLHNLNIKAAGSVNAKAKTGGASEASELTTHGLTVSMTGVSGKDTLDIKFDAPKLLMTRDKASGDKIAVSAKITNAQGVTQVNVQLPGITGTAQAFSATAMTLDAEIKQGPKTIKAQLRSPLSGNLQTHQVSLPNLTVNVTAAGPDIPGQSLTGSLSGNASINGSKQQVQATLAGKIANSTIKAQLGVNGFTPPGLNFDIDIDQLDWDAYSAQAPKGEKPTAGGADKPIDLSALRTLRANGKLRIGSLKASGLKATNVRLDIRAAGGQIEVSPLSANLYEGAMNGGVTVNAAQATPSFAIKQNLSGVAIGPLLKDLANKDTLEGKGTVNVDVRTQGATVAALKRALAGGASVNLRDGSIKGINVAATIRDARAMLSSARGQAAPQTKQADKNQKTDFSELTGTFAIQNGVARNNDLSMKSPLLRVTGEGDINVGEDTINYVVKASVVGTLTGQDGREIKELKGVTVPVRASGPLVSPSFSLDFNSMLTDSVKQKAEELVRSKLEEQFFGKKPAAAQSGAPAASGATGAKPPDAPKSDRDLAKDVLKGIFGR